MPRNESLKKPNAVDFTWVMTKALKCAKEIFRRKSKKLENVNANLLRDERERLDPGCANPDVNMIMDQ